MTIYFFLLILNLIFCYIGYNFKLADKVGAIIIVTIMCALCSLRAIDCGTDTVNYYRIFAYNPELSDERLEPLFLLVRNSISNFQVFLAFFAVISYLIIGRIVCKEVRYSSLAVLIFMISPTKFFPESFNIVRQSFACAFILWGFVEWWKNRKIRTIILFVIATSFHYSSVFAFLFLLVSRKKMIKFRTVVILVSVTFLIGILGMTGHLVQNLVTALGEANIHPLITGYAKYGFKVDHTMTLASLFLWLFPLSLFAIVSYPFKSKAKSHVCYLYNVFMIGTIIGNVFIPALDWGLRFVFSIMITQILAIPIALKYSSKAQKICIVTSIGVCILAYAYYIVHLQYFPATSIVPYKSILF